MKGYIPSSIQFNILVRLPVKSLTRFKSLSKSLCSLISGEDFIYTHLNHQSHKETNPTRHHHQSLILSSIRNVSSITTATFFITNVNGDGVASADAAEFSAPVTYDSYHFLPSCNGLVCFYGAYEHGIYVSNPATRSLFRLPDSGIRTPGSFSCGFGFDPVSRKHKVIKMFKSSDGDPCNEFEFSIFSLGGSSSWRPVRDKPGFQVQNKQPPIFANGFFYWITQNSSGFIIVSFDVGDERFGLVHPPEEMQHRNWCMSCLQELGGNLCIVDMDFAGEGNKRMDIWTFRDGGGGGRWWVQESIVHETEAVDGCRPVAVGGNKEVLLNGLGSLNWYDLESGSFRAAILEGVPFSHYFVSPHVESLAPFTYE